MANRLAEFERAQLPPGAYWPPARADRQNTQQQMSALLKQATRWIMEHPEIALTTAVVTGVVLGWLIKRR